MATDGNQEENHADEFDELNLQLTKYIGGPATLGTTKKTPPPPDDDGVIQAELQKLKKSYLVLTDLIDKGKSHEPWTGQMKSRAELNMKFSVRIV